jgi:hypothetical protein
MFLWTSLVVVPGNQFLKVRFDFPDGDQDAQTLKLDVVTKAQALLQNLATQEGRQSMFTRCKKFLHRFSHLIVNQLNN